MSRIGRMPIPVPAGVSVEIASGTVSVTGPRGSLSERISPEITVAQEDGVLVVTRPTDRSQHRALHGLTRTLVANMVVGVTEGYSKRLEIQGVGYRAALRGSDLEMQLGFSHAVTVKAPEGISFEVPQPTQIIVSGSSKQQVGEIAAQIRKWRPPEPYKGKGVRYAGEHVIRKVGKRA
ncbi:MAG TPA: 50S ribosomal protein L6 [Gaiellales bacterium]